MTDSILSLSLLANYEDGGRNHLLHFRNYKNTGRRLPQNNNARRQRSGILDFPNWTYCAWLVTYMDKIATPRHVKDPLKLWQS
jgi:hypothetical protein